MYSRERSDSGAKRRQRLFFVNERLHSDGMKSRLALAILSLVVPYFEVSIEPDNRNFDTRITIANSSAEAQKVRVNLWMDRARAIFWYTTEIEARGTKTISMRELLVDGKLSVCIGPPDAGSRIMGAARCTLTTGCEFIWHVPNPQCERKVGNRHAHAMGYVTLDVVTRCDDLTSPEDPRYETRTEPLDMRYCALTW